MRNVIIILFSLLCFSCKTKDNSLDVVQKNERYKMSDLPNKETQFDSIFGDGNAITESATLNKLTLKLTQNHFKVDKAQPSSVPFKFRLYNENRIISLMNVSTIKLFARSSISDKRMKNTFPDFTVYEMNFKNEQDAQYVIELFYKSRHQPIVEELISVDKIFSKENKVYYFETRAEMFRDYINKYAETIK